MLHVKTTAVYCNYMCNYMQYTVCYMYVTYSKHLIFGDEGGNGDLKCIRYIEMQETLSKS